MVDYEEKLLSLLVEKYRMSRKDSGTNLISRRTQIVPEKLYKNYKKNDGDLEQIEAVNQVVTSCQKKGFLTFEMNGFSNEIAKIYLVDEKVAEIEGYLKENYQYESKQEKRQYIEAMIKEYGGRFPIAEEECRKLRLALDKNRIPKDYRLTKDVLKALVFIENNRNPLYLREASMLIYGSSKYLEENTLENVCRLIRSYWKEPCQEDELPDEILEKYQITKEKQKLCMKGDITLWIAGRALELGVFHEGIEFFSEELERIERIEIHAKELMSVENRTSYLRSHKSGMAYFYLGGYATRFQRDFLKKIYRDNKELRYLHFGDIDAGGFYIYEHLCRITGIPFEMYRMSVEELCNPRFQGCLQKLTENERIRLEKLGGEEKFRDVVEYMLRKDVKLEQEVVSYSESERNSKL